VLPLEPSFEVLAKASGEVVTSADPHAICGGFFFGSGAIDRVTDYEKSKFPTLEVYGPSSTPVLRLVTCSRLVDGRFTDNLVVFAHLEDPK